MKRRKRKKKEEGNNIMCSELGTLEWDTFNPDCLIRISNVDTFKFLLNPLFFGYSTENQKQIFQN